MRKQLIQIFLCLATVTAAAQTQDITLTLDRTIEMATDSSLEAFRSKNMRSGNSRPVSTALSRQESRYSSLRRANGADFLTRSKAGSSAKRLNWVAEVGMYGVCRIRDSAMMCAKERVRSAYRCTATTTMNCMNGRRS